MKYFLDENLSPRIARALNALGSSEYGAVQHLFEKFEMGTADDVWMPTLGDEGDWSVVTADREILRNPHLRKVWKDSRLTTFFLEKAWLSLRLWDQAAKLVQRWPTIAQAASGIQAGTGFLVPVRSPKMTVVFGP